MKILPSFFNTKIMNKKIILLLGALYMTITGFAQEATTNWPYIFNDFKPATIYMQDGTKKDYMVNIHLVNATLNYLEDNKIMNVKDSDALVITIGNRHFMNVQGKIMEIVAEQDNGFIAELKKADITKVNETGGAYGTSSNTLSTKPLSSLENMANGDFGSHMQQKNSKNDGKVLPIIEEYYIVANKQVYPANRKAISEILPADKQQAYKQFLKEHKIKWKEPDSLLQLVNLFY